MKKTYLILLLFVSTFIFNSQLKAQSGATKAVSNYASDTLNINNVSANFLPFGNDFWRDSPVSTIHQYVVPAGSGKSTVFTSIPWIGGLDQSNNLHLAGETYRANSEDYFFGPVLDTNTLAQYSDSLWNRVWKISKAEIDYHKNNYWKSSYVVPEAIANWPAKGDPNLGQNTVMAPFIDKNNDGNYVPTDGDYPKMRGDQMVFLIFNDSRSAHTESGGLPLGVEYHQTAYAYDCSSDTALNHTVFVHYDIYNRSAHNYHDVYLGIFTDFDIGYGYDDYIGCDSSRNMYYGYNGTAIDGIGLMGDYGANPPAQGVVLLSDTMTSFISFNNIGLSGVQRDPESDTNFYDYMRARWGDGSYLTYGGDGYQGTTPVNYIYSGDPNDTNTWSEAYPKGTQIAPYDRRGTGSIAPFSLDAGAVKSLDIAYVYARESGKSNIENVTVLKRFVDDIQGYYDNDSTPCGGSFTAIAKANLNTNKIRIYPVPADNEVFVDYLPTSNTASYEVYSISGQLLQSGRLNKQKTHRLDFTDYKAGLYFVLIRDGAHVLSKKLIIE